MLPLSDRDEAVSRRIYEAAKPGIVLLQNILRHQVLAANRVAVAEERRTDGRSE